MDRTYFVSIRATGLDLARDHIFELSAAPVFDTGRAQFHTYINPCVSMPPETLAAHGIQPATLVRAPTFSLAMGQFLQYVTPRAAKTSSASPIPIILVAHNGHRYQWPLMTRELRWARFTIHHPIWLWDTLHLCRRLYPTPLPSMRLYDIDAVLFPAVATRGGVTNTCHDIEILHRMLPVVACHVARETVDMRLDPARVFAQLSAANKEVVVTSGASPFATRHMSVNGVEKDAWPVVVCGTTETMDCVESLRARLATFQERGSPLLDQLLARRQQREDEGSSSPIPLGAEDGHEPVEAACDLLCEAALYIHKASCSGAKGLEECCALAQLMTSLASE